MTTRWLRYEPTVFATGINVSQEDLDTLNRAGLPKVGIGVGKTLEKPVGVDMPGRGYLIRFSQGRPDGWYCRADYYYDPSTGEVLYINEALGYVPELINSTLGQFTRTAKAIIEAFPFYDDLGRDLNEVDVDVLGDMYEASGARLTAIIREIDPVAMDLGSHWETFVQDVINGDYATEDILRAYEPQPAQSSIE